VDRFKLQAFVMPQASRTRCMLASGTDLGCALVVFGEAIADGEMEA
jgi:hypothetical protein